MKCIECKEDMNLIGVNDAPGEGFAYNIYHCLYCMIVAKEDVWKHPGVMWIDKENNTEFTRIGATG